MDGLVSKKFWQNEVCMQGEVGVSDSVVALTGLRQFNVEVGKEETYLDMFLTCSSLDRGVADAQEGQ